MLLLAFLLAGPSANGAQVCSAPASSSRVTADARVPDLARGINASAWEPHDWVARPDPRALGLEDLRFLRDLGFTYVRLQVNPTTITHADTLATRPLKCLLMGLAAVTSLGLSAVVDVHPADESKARLLGTWEGIGWYVGVLRSLARTIERARLGPVGLELMNEPFRPAGARATWNWNELQSIMWRAAREGSSAVTLLLSGDDGSSVAGLERVVPVPDSNVVYVVHFYNSYVFTHQGASWASWAGSPYQYMARIPYPADSGRMDAVVSDILRRMPDSAGRERARVMLERYAAERWNASRILAVLAPVANWGRINRARVVVNEFGVFAHMVDKRDRAAWLGDVRAAVERLGMGWAMWRYWDHGAGFGLVDHQRRVDAGIVSALGLRCPQEGGNRAINCVADGQLGTP